MRVLFVGNSFTAAHGMPERVRALAAEVGVSMDVEVVASGGATLEKHAAGVRSGRGVGRWLGPRRARVDETWDAVVLQEQSQLGGLPRRHPQVAGSLAGAVELAAAARAQGAVPVIFETWGRRAGDLTFPGWYPDYLVMQARLTEGARRLAMTVGRPVLVASVGSAFRKVFERDARAFEGLFAADGAHPSAAGSALAAEVLAGVLCG